ncbi:peptidyl-prolyl cis-trans isomerase NIMA-interacting 1 isoform X1 [Pan paniscus]|uniref:peptidyl-prolyl cis-trans isomerase NIMA-interacting 1 isoform X1 n=1 Tax=Pan paniscus TaxID=9597 RepID=UPI001560A5A7|nr:peptidyl-prolyl cis-trans isomerase NIMA-interacting 1 isoform X1 [Pan paniscus]
MQTVGGEPGEELCCLPLGPWGYSPRVSLAEPTRVPWRPIPVPGYSFQMGQLGPWAAVAVLGFLWTALPPLPRGPGGPAPCLGQPLPACCSPLAHPACYIQKIKSGEEDFESLASQFSDCSSAKARGDLGAFSRGQMQKPFEDASFALRTGEMSGPVFTDSGIHIILRTE